MGRLLQTVFALFIAILVIAPQQLATHFDTPGYRALKAETAAGHPSRELVAAVAELLDGTREGPGRF